MNAEDYRRTRDFNQSSHDSAVGLVTLPSLRSLDIDGVRLDQSFYRGMLLVGHESQVIIKEIHFH